MTGLAGRFRKDDEPDVAENVLDVAIVAGERAQRALGGARRAWAAALSAHARLAHDATVRFRRTRCGLRILGLPHAAAMIDARAAIHARVCPGGDRAHAWSPLVHRSDASPRADYVSPLRLVRGGAAVRR
jgi:hypothetical protein